MPHRAVARKSWSRLLPFLALVLLAAQAQAMTHFIDLLPVKVSEEPCDAEGWKYVYVELAVRNNSGQFASLMLKSPTLVMVSGHEYGADSSFGRMPFVRGAKTNMGYTGHVPPYTTVLGCGDFDTKGNRAFTHFVFRVPQPMEPERLVFPASRYSPGTRSAVPLPESMLTVQLKDAPLLDLAALPYDEEQAAYLRDGLAPPYWFASVVDSVQVVRSHLEDEDEVVVTLDFHNPEIDRDYRSTATFYLLGSSGIVYLLEDHFPRGNYVKGLNETGIDLMAGPGMTKTATGRFLIPTDETKLVLVWWDMEYPTAMTYRGHVNYRIGD